MLGPIRPDCYKCLFIAELLLSSITKCLKIATSFGWIYFQVCAMCTSCKNRETDTIILKKDGSLTTTHPGPKDLVLSHRASWGILPQTPVFSLRSARCHWYRSITVLTEHPGPNHLLESHRTSWGILPQTPVFSLRSARCHW